MSEPICLTVEEVAEVTGARWRRTQMRWFASHGIPAELGADGRVKVLRAAFQARMMPGARQRKKTEPRLDLL